MHKSNVENTEAGFSSHIDTSEAEQTPHILSLQSHAARTSLSNDSSGHICAPESSELLTSAATV